MSTFDISAPFTAAELVETLRGRADAGVILSAAMRALFPDYIASLSSIELAEAFEDKTAGYERFQAAARILDRGRRAKVIALCAGMGKTEEETRAFLAGAFDGAKTDAEPPVKRPKAPRARPEADVDDDTLLVALLSILGKGRATSKGLASKFSGLEIDRVRRVLSDEAARGASARVKLEPNGRTWVRTVGP